MSPIHPIWINLSKYFIKHRISSEAKKILDNNPDLNLNKRSALFSSNQKSVDISKRLHYRQII